MSAAYIDEGDCATTGISHSARTSSTGLIYQQEEKYRCAQFYRQLDRHTTSTFEAGGAAVVLEHNNVKTKNPNQHQFSFLLPSKGSPNTALWEELLLRRLTVTTTDLESILRLDVSVQKAKVILADQGSGHSFYLRALPACDHGAMSPDLEAYEPNP